MLFVNQLPPLLFNGLDVSVSVN